ncbi:MAG: hypothetical protein JSW07_19030, partial [bacterium]
MKKISYIIVLLYSIVLLATTAGVSQVQNSVLIWIESPNFKLLSKMPSLKPYYYDDSCLIGEIDADK